MVNFMGIRQVINFALYISLLATILVSSLYGISLLYFETGNLAGALLTVVAISITGVGLILSFLGTKEVDEKATLWKNEKVIFHLGNVDPIYYPFHLDKPSMIEGSVVGISGPYSYHITEFFGTEEEMSFNSVVSPKIHFNGKGPNENSQIPDIIGPINLPQGNYALKFALITRKVETNFSLMKTIRRKPHESFYSFGLTLLEVGVPVLITGIISLIFGNLFV